MSIDEVLQLQQPVTDGAIRAVRFFNGRLLTANDLTRQQQARREADRYLGLALGDGVAFGLDVTEDRQQSEPGHPVIRIEAGLAINRLGQTLRLRDPTSVALTRAFETTATEGLFATCTPIAGGTYIAGAGLYVLTIAPAEASEGRAETNGLDPSNVRCNTDATVEAVLFRRLWIKPTLFADLDPGSPAFRNAIAYRCFGGGVQATWLADLFGAQPRGDGLIDNLRPSPLVDQEVPLALLFFTGSADLQFIDLWSVRRPPALSQADGPLPRLADTRRIAVGQAMFHQFQAQVAEWAPTADLGAVTARSHCRYLPPVGIIPVAEETDKTDANATRFFKDMTYRGPAFINAARLEALVRDSLCYPPIDARGDELVWLYRVRENGMAIDFAGREKAPRSCLVFASGHMPYLGDAQFDLAHFDYANYALAR